MAFSLKCSRCGMPVRYKTRGGMYKAKRRHEGRPFLCADCEKDMRRADESGSELPDVNVEYESRTCAIVRCPGCGETRKLSGSTAVANFGMLHGRCGERYLCRKCASKGKVPKERVCSVCGERSPFPNPDAARKFLERHPPWNPYVCRDCRRKAAEERNTLVCSVCGREVPAKTRYQKRLRRWCGSGRSVFVCESCRSVRAKYAVSSAKRRVPLIRTPEYAELAAKCADVYREYVSSGFSDRGMERMLNGLGDLLSSANIYDFDLDVVNGTVRGVLLRGVSVYGEVYVRF